MIGYLAEENIEDSLWLVVDHPNVNVDPIMLIKLTVIFVSLFYKMNTTCKFPD